MSKVLNQGSSSCCSCSSCALTFDINPNTDAMIFIIFPTSFWLQTHIKSNKRNSCLVWLKQCPQLRPSGWTWTFVVSLLGRQAHVYIDTDGSQKIQIILYELFMNGFVMSKSSWRFTSKVFQKFFVDFLTFTQLFSLFSTSRNYIKSKTSEI